MMIKRVFSINKEFIQYMYVDLTFKKLYKYVSHG